MRVFVKSLLGRWCTYIPEEQKTVKAIWANSDNCADSYCQKQYGKDPKIVKAIIQKENTTEVDDELFVKQSKNKW